MPSHGIDRGSNPLGTTIKAHQNFGFGGLFCLCSRRAVRLCRRVSSGVAAKPLRPRYRARRVK